jgi:hypothetical protein
MSPEKTHELCAKHPGILKEDFYFECDDGWFDLLETLFIEIEAYCSQTEQVYPKAAQIKEKFGLLRIYLDGADSTVNRMTWLTEHMSGRICEQCGNKGKLRRIKSWSGTVCPPCFEKVTDALNVRTV